jgi:diadenosine tetraphosphate (Ap4A) HIT family hydrolase
MLAATRRRHAYLRGADKGLFKNGFRSLADSLQNGFFSHLCKPLRVFRNSRGEATWRSGYAADCKSVYSGSIPDVASSLLSSPPRQARMTERKPSDLAAYTERTRSKPCFICELLAGNPDFAHHVIAEDDETIIFLNKYPTMRGYALVCPKAHREDLAEELSRDEYLRLQAKVHRLALALKRVFDAERIYVLSLGSQQGNRHLHFHVAPLPKGVPYEQQQYHALMAEHGVLPIPDAEMAAMAQEIGEAYAATQ